MAAIKNSFQRSVQWSPAMHREQPVGGLRGGSARRASGVGKHLIRRRSKLERPAERRQDGAEGLQPLGPSAGRAPASRPTRSVDGRRLARLGPLSPSRAAPPALADAIRDPSSMVAGHEWAAAAELVQPGSVRGAPNSRPAYERFVRVSSQPLMEPPTHGRAPGQSRGRGCVARRSGTTPTGEPTFARS